MTLTGKDLITTLLAVATVGLYYAMTKGIDLPIISGYRGAILVLAVIGIAMCALGAGNGTSAPTGIWSFAAGALGVAALVVIVYGLITGAKIAFILLVGTIIALWGLATVRHFLGA